MPAEDAAEVRGVLVTGEPYRVTAEAFILGRAGAPVPLRVRSQEITAVGRGGMEVVLTRRAADPIVCVLPTLAAARELETALYRLLAAEPPPRRVPFG